MALTDDLRVLADAYGVTLIRKADGESFTYGFARLPDAERFRDQMNGVRPDGLPGLYHVSTIEGKGTA